MDVVVVGCGIGGLSAAVAALESGASVTLIERATKEERGGQTRYTEAYFRMKSHTEVTDDFESHLAENAGGYVDPKLMHEMASGPRESWPDWARAINFVDPGFITAFSEHVPSTVAWLKELKIRFDFLPTQFLTKSQPRLLPVGGGLAMIEALFTEVERRGATILYEHAATALSLSNDGLVRGVVCLLADGRRQVISGRSVVLACGGFEGNAEMLTRYLGPSSVNLRPICRGGYYNKGEGIEMAIAIGASTCGEFGSYHAEPIDPRSGVAEPSVFIFPYGILVNKQGHRFADEAPGTVDAWYERVTREIYSQKDGLAYCILDAKHMDIPNYRLGIRTDQPPVAADSVEELASKLNLPLGSLVETIKTYNNACPNGRGYNPLQADQLATTSLFPPKSNWALPLEKPPFHAYPIISANVFTFGGLKIDEHARVLNTQGNAIPGLYAAGEIIGSYYRNYTGATSVMKGAVFGRLAGKDAAGRAAKMQSIAHTLLSWSRAT